MKKDVVKIYRSEKLAAKALSEYIRRNPVIDAREASFSDDDYIHEFEFIGMREREWSGYMDGIRVRAENGYNIIFASWDIDDINDEEEQQYDYDQAFCMFVQSLMQQ